MKILRRKTTTKDSSLLNFKFFEKVYIKFNNMRRSLKYTIIFSFVFVILLPTTLYALYFFFDVSTTYKENAERTFNSFIDENFTNINYQYDNISNTSLSILVNSNIIDILDTEIIKNYEKIILQSKFEKELNPFLLFNPSWNDSLIKSIFLLKDFDNYYYIFKDTTSVLQQIFDSLDVLKENIGNHKLPTFIHSSEKEGSIFLLRECYELSTAERKGYLLIELDSNLLFNFDILVKNYNTLKYVTYNTETDMIISTSYEDLLGQSVPDKFLKKLNSDSSEIILDSKKHIILEKPINDSNLSTILLVEYDDVFSNLDKTIVKFIFIFMILTLICIILYFKMYHIFSDPLNNLLGSIKKVQEGNFKIKMPEYTFTELNDISFVFNNMSDEINNLINQVYDKQLLIKESELKFLKSQIDPHFIFNVLDTINWHAKLNNDLTICDLTTNLSKLLRANINFDGNEKVPLKEELEYIDFYIKLQKSRFQDRLKFKITIADENLLENKVPKLCIQPLVENAIIHGLEPKLEGGSLNIQIWEEDSDIYFLIIDDGVGFNAKEIMYSPDDPIDLRKKGHKSIALHNILRRLELLYEGNYSFQIDSKPKEGCRIRLSIPLDKEDGHV